MLSTQNRFSVLASNTAAFSAFREIKECYMHCITYYHDVFVEREGTIQEQKTSEEDVRGRNILGRQTFRV